MKRGWPMLMFGIIFAAALLYFLFLAWILVFFAGVNKMNRHWKRAFRKMPDTDDGRPERRHAA